VFIERPICAFFLALCVLLIAAQIYFRMRDSKRNKLFPAVG
jgi:hypothetical protein